MSAEDIRRKCVKFILADDGHSRVVNVEDCPRGSDVLELVLRKFGKSGGIGFPPMAGSDELDILGSDDGLVVDGWGVFLDNGHGDSPGARVVLSMHMHASFFSMFTLTAYRQAAH